MIPSFVEMTNFSNLGALKRSCDWSKNEKSQFWYYPCVAITVILRILWLRRGRAALHCGFRRPRCNVIIADLSKALSELLRGGVLNETRVLCCLLDGISIFLNINNFVWIWFDKTHFILCIHNCSWLIFNISRILINLDNWICQHYKNN